MNLPIPLLLRGMLAAAVAGLACCSTAPLASSPSYEAGSSRAAGAPAAAARLGTGWGESRDSRVMATSFERAHARPDGVGELHYNDPIPFLRIAGDSVFLDPHNPKFRGLRQLAGGRVGVGVKDGRGNWLRGVERDGHSYVLGQKGERYELVVRNLLPYRIEVVVSVDGLDVLDGRSASFTKRGHLIEPRGTITISGWRTSSSSVAAFRFAAVEDSYTAKKHGDTRNVGVIGVAVFTEKSPPMRVFAEPPLDTREPHPFPGERWARPPQG